MIPGRLPQLVRFPNCNGVQKQVRVGEPDYQLPSVSICHPNALSLLILLSIETLFWSNIALFDPYTFLKHNSDTDDGKGTALDILVQHESTTSVVDKTRKNGFKTHTTLGGKNKTRKTQTICVHSVGDNAGPHPL